MTVNADTTWSISEDCVGYLQTFHFIWRKLGYPQIIFLSMEDPETDSQPPLEIISQDKNLSLLLLVSSVVMKFKLSEIMSKERERKIYLTLCDSR